MLQDNLKKAVEEEKEIAIAKGCFHEGIIKENHML